MADQKKQTKNHDREDKPLRVGLFQIARTSDPVLAQVVDAMRRNSEAKGKGKK